MELSQNLLAAWFLLAIATAFTAPVVSAQEPAAAPPATLRIEFQSYELPQARAVALLPLLVDDATAAAAFAELQSDVEHFRARLLFTLIGFGRSGERIESIHREEFRYAIEFEFANPCLVPASPPGHPLSVPYPGTFFETRHLGPELSFEWTDHPAFPFFRLQTKDCRLDGWDRAEAEVLANGTHLHTEQPIICSRRASVLVPLRSDRPILAGAYQIPEKPGFFELHVVTSHVRRFGAPNPPPTAPPPPWVRVELQRFRLPQAEALALRPRLVDPAQIDSAFSDLLDLAAHGRAELRAWATLPTVHNQRAVVENLRERRYVTETESMPQGFGSPAIEITYDNLDDVVGNSAPTTFESRNVGETLEAEPTVSDDGRSVDLLLGITRVEFDGFQRLARGPNFAGTYSYFYFPKFKTRRTTTTLTLANGERLLFAFTRLLTPAETCELVLLRATAAPTQK